MTTSNAKKPNIPPTNRDLLNAPAIAHLATIRPDGTLQSTPVWFDWDGTHIKISTTTDRQKLRNIEHDPRVALSITDPDNPYRYIEIRGVVDAIADDPDRELIDELSERYMGTRPYPHDDPSARRVIISVRPTDSYAQAA